jgi:hypothetical protein
MEVSSVHLMIHVVGMFAVIHPHGMIIMVAIPMVPHIVMVMTPPENTAGGSQQRGGES